MSALGETRRCTFCRRVFGPNEVVSSMEVQPEQGEKGWVHSPQCRDDWLVLEQWGHLDALREPISARNLESYLAGRDEDELVETLGRLALYDWLHSADLSVGFSAAPEDERLAYRVYALVR
jgi:hypothetical protein